MVYAMQFFTSLEVIATSCDFLLYVYFYAVFMGLPKSVRHELTRMKLMFNLKFVNRDLYFIFIVAAHSNREPQLVIWPIERGQPFTTARIVMQ